MKKYLRAIISIVLVTILLVTAIPVYAVDDKTVTEIEDLREENIKHFEMDDGTYKAVVYNEAVHRKDADGKWQDIDNTLSSVNENGNTSYASKDGRIRFFKDVKSAGGKIFELSENGYKISLLLSNTKSVNAEINNHKNKKSVSVFDSQEEQLEKLKSVDNLTKVRYNKIKDGIDIEYEIYANNVKENIIVYSKQSDYVFRFDLKLNNLTAVLNDDGTISINDEKTGTTAYIMPAPFMFDDNGDISTEVNYTLVQKNKSHYELTVTADAEWINHSDRKFPVTIDPTIEVDNSYGEAYVSSANPNTNYKKPSDGRLFVSSTQRTFLKFSLPTLPVNNNVTSAHLITQYYFYGSTGNMSIGAYAVPYSWNENTITWNNSVASHQSADNAAPILSTNSISSSISATESAPLVLPFDVTDAVIDWYSGSANNGIAIKRLSGMTDAIAFKGYNSVSFVGPLLEISYQIVLNGSFYIGNAETSNYIQSGTSSPSILYFDGDTDQKWQITYLNNGHHKITSVTNGLALTAPSSAGGAVTLSSYNGSSTQMWSITKDSNGYFKISPKNNQTLFISGSNIGANVIINTSQPSSKIDEWKISQYIDYALAYVGTSINDPYMPFLINDAVENLKTNANAVGFSNNIVTNEECGSIIQETEVFISLSHGSKDAIMLSNNTRFDIDYLEEENITDLSNLKFVCFAACLTGEGGTGADNLVNAMVDRGAQNVLGFKIEILILETNDWLDKFVYSLSNGNTIDYAMKYADRTVESNTTTGKTNRHFVGNYNTVLFD